MWNEFPERDELDGVTVFTAQDSCSAEQVLIDGFETIDLHHGIYSANPPYTIIRVIGFSLTEAIEAIMSQYGFDSFTITIERFRAVRPVPRAKNGRKMTPSKNS